MQAIRQKVTVKADGRLEIMAAELHEGMDVEVTIVLKELNNTQKIQPPNHSIAERLRLIAKEHKDAQRQVQPDPSDLSSDLFGLSRKNDINEQLHNQHLIDEADRQIAIEKARQTLRRFVPEEISLVDELINERRKENKLD